MISWAIPLVDPEGVIGGCQKMEEAALIWTQERCPSWGWERLLSLGLPFLSRLHLVYTWSSTSNHRMSGIKQPDLFLGGHWGLVEKTFVVVDLRTLGLGFNLSLATYYLCDFGLVISLDLCLICKRKGLG